MKDITKLLLQNKEQQTELEIFMTGYFDNSAQKEPNKILHGNGLIVEYYKNNSRIKSITINEDVVVKDDLISKAKESMATNLGDQIQSIFVLSPIKMNGYFKYQNKFQILPAPFNAPKVDYALASHAFNLEFSFPKSTHMQINIHRSSKKSKEIILLLNSLLRHGINLKERSSTYEWGLVIKNNKFSCEYVNLGYFGGSDDREKDGDGFTLCTEYPELKLKKTNLYYSSYGISASDTDDTYLPDNFEQSLKVFESLSQANQEMFLRASYWTQVAYKTFHISFSLAYSALITSIEVFLPNPKTRCTECNRPTSEECCSTCKQPSSGPTKQFRDFVDKYSPGVKESARKKLYDIRSTITHGGSLLPGDAFQLGIEFNARTNDARNNWDLLSQIVQIVQINWLHADK